MLAAEVEPNDSLGTATAFTDTAVLTGSLSSLRDVDHFKTNLTLGQRLTVVHEAAGIQGTPALAPIMQWFDPSGEMIASSMDARSLSIIAANSGEYTLRLSPFNVFGSADLAYTINATIDPFTGDPEVEPNDTISTATALDREPNFSGSLARASDIDYFSFNATAGEAIAIRLAGSPANNTAIRLYAPTGELIATDRDGLGLVTIAPVSGLYALDIQSDNAQGVVTGEYAGQLLVAPNGTLHAAQGGLFDSAVNLDLGPYVVSSAYLSPDETFSQQGLTGSYINQNLRGAPQSDWTSTQTVAGTRVDPVIHFSQSDWGNRAGLNLTQGTSGDWDNFSVQWDGYIRIVTPGTRIFTASDDSSRLWIDLNDDGTFDAAGNEFVNNHWGRGQGTTLSNASMPLDVGVYRIRYQYEEGGGGNQAYLLWDDKEHSAGLVAMNRPSHGMGTLTSMSEVDVYSIDVTGTGLYEFRLDGIASGLSSQGRVIELYNEYGQLLESSTAGRVGTNRFGALGTRPEITGRYFIAIRATDEIGLGAYALTASITGEFPKLRDIPLFFQDHSTYSQPENVDLFLAFFDSRFDIYQVDNTEEQPAAPREFVRWTFTDEQCGGFAGGGTGLRSVGGNGVGGACSQEWNRLSDIWFLLSYHENGHAVGLPHSRHPLTAMSYGGQFDYFPIGSFYAMDTDGRISTPKLQNERNYLDWVLESGRIILEGESNDDQPSAQPLTPFLDTMSVDAETRNDQVVVIGSIHSATDVDLYRFTAQANETFALDVDAAEFQFPLDAKLEILDQDGNVIATSEGGIDRDTGILSVDPHLIHQFTEDGDYFIRLSSENTTAGYYRLKLTHEDAFDGDGPRIAAMWPDGGVSVDGTRQLIFWTNDQLDPQTINAANVVITGQSTGVRAGNAVFEPITSTLTWLADEPLAPDTYEVRLMGGASGITDLWGNPLDGETDGTLTFPEVSGNGTPGGNFVSRFTVTAADTTPAIVTSSTFNRQQHDRVMFQIFFSDELDVRDVYSKEFTLRGAGPDNQFDTDDDTFSPVDVIYDRITNTSNRRLIVYTRGVPELDTYRVEAELQDAAGHAVTLAEVFTISAAVPSNALFTTIAQTTQGLVGSYVNRSLRTVSTHDDWRSSQTIAGDRVDPMIDFSTNSLGTRAQVGITGGTDANWDNFSVQWDGFIEIPADGVRLFTRSDDGSRMWIDLNDDGAFDTTGDEFINNGWGRGQGATTSPGSVPLDAGLYRIRVQYEEGGGGNQIHLTWDYKDGPAQIEGLTSNPQVVDLSVQPGTVVTLPPASIDISFSQSIDPATLNSTNFRLRHSPNSSFFDDNDTYIDDADGQIDWNPQLRQATFTPSAPLANGHYLIELDAGLSGIRARSGRRLDGEYLDSNIAGFTPEYGWTMSPSGDGLEGGDYRAMFVVVGSPRLRLSIPETPFFENAGPQTLSATISRSESNNDQALIVTLTSSDATEAVVPNTVTIPAGASSVTFPITAVDDRLLDGTQQTRITATANGFEAGSATATVLDHETLTVTIDASAISENGPPTTVTVTRSNTDITQPLVVTLSTNDPTELAVPASVTIPANESSVSFSINGINDAARDGIQSPSVNASANGYVGISDSVQVNDPPFISNIANAVGTAGVATTIDFSVLGLLNGLVISASSSDAALVPSGNMVLGGTATARSVTITPVAGQSGNITITVIATDTLGGTTERSFGFRVIPPIIVKTDPVITWPAPDDITFGEPLSEVQLNASSNTPGRFTYTPIEGHVLSAGADQQLRVTFTPTDTVNFNTATATVTINVAKAEPTITWPDPPDIFVGTALSTLQLNAIASVPGTFVYSRPLGTILPLGLSQNIRVDFTPTDNSNFVNATRTAQINVVEPTLDYGDAPSRYPVTLAQDGARHRVSDLFLGSNRSAEAAAKPSPSADGDAGDDGIAFATTILSASVVTTSSLIVTSSGAGWLDGWIDFNNDGDWLDAGEQISVSTPVDAGRNLISFQVPAGAATGNIAARFRLSSAGNLAPIGEANDGEVEDYLTRIVAGAPSANVNVSLFDGDTRISEVAGELVIEQETTLFRAPITRFASVVIVGTNADETLHLTHFDELAEKSIRIDGGSGDDRMVLPAAEHSVDLTAPNLTIRNIETIDTKESGKSYLQLNLDAVKAMATSSDIVEVIAKLGDRIDFGLGWQIDAPRFIDGNFTHIIRESAAEGTAEVRLRNDRMLQNPLNKFDADRDGKILPLDALRIINELRRRGAGPIQLPTDNNQVSRLYFDVSGDNQFTALDALRIINALSRINRGGRPEGEQAAIPLETSSPANNADLDTNIIMVRENFTSSDSHAKRVAHANDLTLLDVAFAATDDWGDEQDDDVRKDLRNDAFGVTLLSDD